MSWKTVTLGEIIELQNGYAFKSSEYAEDGYFLMRITNVQQGFIQNNNPKYVTIPESSKLKQFILNEGDILMSLTGDVGRVGVLNESNLPAALNQRVARVVIKSTRDVNKNYIFNLLNSEIIRNQIESLGHGAAQLNVSTKDILSVKVQLPSIATQQKIVEKLDAIFSEIDTATAAAETNANNAEALFQSYLTEVFERGGEGWERKTIEEITDKTKNVSPDKSPDIEFTYVDVSSISNTSYSIISTQKLLGKDAPSRAKKNINTNDILFATVRPTLKRIAIVPEFLENQVASTGYVVLRTNKNNYHKFLFYFLFTSTFNDAMESLQRGASYPAVTDSDVKSQKLLVPSYEEQYKISEKLEQIKNSINIKINSDLRKIEELKVLKQAILKQAFSGELVKDSV